MHGHVLAPVLVHILKKTVSLTLVLRQRSRVGASSYHTLIMDIQGMRGKGFKVSYLISIPEARWGTKEQHTLQFYSTLTLFPFA